MWRKLRIVILLFILATVAHRAWLQEQHLQWKDTLYVAVYPVNAGNQPQVVEYIANLEAEQFGLIADFLAEEAERYQLNVRRPFEFKLGPPVIELPPKPPQGGSALQAISWSLRFRWWTWNNNPPVSVPADIQLYLLYHDPGQYETLPHSTALNKGRVGLIHVFADQKYEKQNAVIVAHELLHTLGATDKYDFADNLPLYPEGYAEPDKQPLYPQDFAELMAGRLPISSNQADIPAGLIETLIGSKTAMEIGWQH